jgi:hypothetical protein
MSDHTISKLAVRGCTVVTRVQRCGQLGIGSCYGQRD